MRLTLGNYVELGKDQELLRGDLGSPEAWDALRLGGDSAFAISHTADELEALADASAGIRMRAEAIDSWLRTHGTHALTSYGVGTAILEKWLVRLSVQRSMIVTEYAPKTVDRLTHVLPEVRVMKHDLLQDPPITDGLHLFHRIDTEFTNREWRSIFRAFATREVILIASEVIDSWRAWQEMKARLRGRPGIKAGLIRNRAAFESLWATTHAAEPLQFHDLKAWYLSPLR